ncbi:TrmH family RNA methyltransferase [Helcococcus kunzii]|uniref:TrmH family RNA methyltransferase n=1 Tax=Helcococcus kunzii TaxID=40091 RepID=UPI001C952DA2|nr:TrmH family RNA methyltransferase [Helcococcus kunzii]QZO76438.1 TrmH family RNA methyltransferase [Helcococcus kunzii]
MSKFKKYAKNEKYSYTLGPFPTWELIDNNSENIVAIFIDDRFNDKEKLINELEKKKIYYEIAPSAIRRIAEKDNTYVVGVFNKTNEEIISENNHVVLHNISDMGNLGTIIRSMAAFNVFDLALVGNTCDIYNPKVIRASMGSYFKIRVSFFDTMEEYIEKHKNNLYLFMLSNDEKDSIYNTKVVSPYSLVMGNEGAGLPDSFEKFGRKVFIPQSKEVDSLNLPIATSIGLYEFRRQDEINSI